MIVDGNVIKVGALLLVYSALVVALTMTILLFLEDIQDKEVTLSTCIFTSVMILLYLFVTIMLCSNLSLPS